MVNKGSYDANNKSALKFYIEATWCDCNESTKNSVTKRNKWVLVWLAMVAQSVKDEREESTSGWSQRRSTSSAPYDLYLRTHGSKSWATVKAVPSEPQYHCSDCNVERILCGEFSCTLPTPSAYSRSYKQDKSQGRYAAVQMHVTASGIINVTEVVQPA
jgi:hypothetical protein